MIYISLEKERIINSGPRKLSAISSIYEGEG